MDHVRGQRLHTLTYDPASPHNPLKSLSHDCGTVDATYRVRALNAIRSSLRSNSITLHNDDCDSYC